MNKIIDLSKKALQIFIVPFILGIITILLHLNIEQTLFTWVIFKIFVVLTLLSHLFAFPALLYLLKEDLSVVESYKRAKDVALSLLFVLILYFVFTFGGTLFLVIPGIIFSVLFSLSFFAVIFERKKGVSALWRSRDLVSGKGWHVFGLLLLVGIIFGFLQGAGELIIEDYQLNYIFSFGYFLSLVHYIALWIVLFNFYEKRKEEVSLISKPKGIKKALFIIPAIPGSLLMLVYFVFVFSILFRDYDPPFDDSHLIMEETEVAEEGNLYFLLKENKAEDLEIEDPLDHVFNEMNYHEFIKENPKEVEKIIKENEEVYEYFEEITAHTHFTTPLSWESIFSNISPGKFLAISRATTFKASYFIENGETERGMQIFLDNMRVGKIMGGDKNQQLIHLLLGIGGQAIAYENMFPFVSEVDISREQAKTYIQKLQSLEISEDSFSRAFLREYTLNANILEYGASEEVMSSKEEVERVNAFIGQTSFFFKPNETKRDLAAFYEPIIEINFEEVKDTKDIPLLYSRLPKDFILETIRGNIIGKILNSAVIPAISGENQLEEIRRNTLQNRAIRIMLALNVYEEEKGKFPDSLEDLVPEYLSEVPKDPFYEDKNIQYSKEERVIYSSYKEEKREEERENYIFEF